MTGQKIPNLKKNAGLKRGLIIGICSVVLIVIFLVVSAPLAKYLFHLDFSQDFRKVSGVEQIRFRDQWNKKTYSRTFWGLKFTGKSEETIEDEKTIDWLDNEEYDVSASGKYVAWYDRETEQIRLSTEDGEVLCSFDTPYFVSHIVISPEENYILYCEIEYGVNGGYSTDEENCYYKVIDIESGETYPIYSGYREWYDLIWE